MSSRPRKPFAIADPPSDRDLVRLYWPAELRPAFDALFDIDAAMADVVARSTQPALGAVKLAWWRERLEELDAGKVPAEPRLQAAARELLARGIAGAALAGLENGWAALLDESPDGERMRERGSRLFGIAAALLGSSDEALAAAGRLFAQAQLARRGLVDAHYPKGGLGRLGRHRFARRLRPLTALAALAARDFERREAPFEIEGTPGRAWTVLRHRLTGRL